MSGSVASRSWPPVIVCVLSSILGLVFFLSSGQDDCYISYGAARNLAATGRITNYNGVALEQSSSLLHTVVLGVLHRLTGLGLPLLGWVVGIGAAGLLLWRSWRLCAFLGVRHRLSTLALIATWPYLLYWWFGGLETTLAAWLLLELIMVAVERRRRSGGLLPRLTLVAFAWVTVRPEGAFVAGAAFLADAFFRGGAQRRRALEDVAATLGALAAACVVRLLLVGAVVPQPVVAKAGGGLLVKAIVGLIYMVENLHVPFGLLVALPLLALPGLILREEDDAAQVTGLVVGAVAGFVLFSGGDWMVGGRFLAVLAAPAIILGVRWVEGAAWAPFPGRLMAVCLGLNVLGVVVFALQSGTGRSLPGYLAARGRLSAAATAEPFSFVELANRVHLRDAVFLGGFYPVLDRLASGGGRMTVLSDQAGMVMYYVSARYGPRVELVDRYGLATRHFTDLAHELRVPPGLAGLRWDYPRFFELGAGRSESFWQPDVIFDVGQVKLRQVREAGYHPVYVQTGTDGRWTVVSQFAAVHPRHRALFPEEAQELRWETLVGAKEPQAL